MTTTHIGPGTGELWGFVASASWKHYKEALRVDCVQVGGRMHGSGSCQGIQCPQLLVVLDAPSTCSECKNFAAESLLVARLLS